MKIWVWTSMLVFCLAYIDAAPLLADDYIQQWRLSNAKSSIVKDKSPDGLNMPKAAEQKIPSPSGSLLDIHPGKYGMAAFAWKDIKKGERIYTPKTMLVPRSLLFWLIQAQGLFESDDGSGNLRRATPHKSKEEIDNTIQRLLEKGWAKDENYFVLCLGDDQFVNHAPTGSGANSKDGIALRDIKKGEEILEDYRLFDRVSWYHHLAKDFNVWITETNQKTE